MGALGVERIQGGPPIPIPRRAARGMVAYPLLKGGHSYSMAAGGFGHVVAFPKLQRFAPPASPHQASDIHLTELYGSHPALFKDRLQRMFNPSRRPPGR